MSVHIESLEGRTLFSVTPAPVAALLAEAKIIATDTHALLLADSAGLKAITAAIRAAKLTKTDAVEIRTSNMANASDLKTVNAAIRAANSALTTDVRKLLSTETSLAKKPTNTKLATQALSQQATLSSAASAALILSTTADTKLLGDDDANVSSLTGVALPTNLITDGDFQSPDVGVGTDGETDLGSPGSGIYEYYTSGAAPAVPVQGPTIDGVWQVLSGSVEVLGADTNVTSPQSAGPFQWIPYEGTQSLDLDGVSPGTIQQNIPTVAGQQYTLTFALAGNPGQNPTKTVQVTAGASSQTFTFDITGKTPTNMGWTLETMVFTATGATTGVTFASLDDSSISAGPALDAISVVANPTASQGNLTTAASNYQTNLAAAVQLLNAAATAALTTQVSNVLALYS